MSGGDSSPLRPRQWSLGVIYCMNNENVIQLSGPFSVTDSLGRSWQLNGIRIFDEGYGIIDVYVDFASSMQDDPLFEDALLIKQIQSRLHALGYVGPDLRVGDLGLQDDKLIVLEAPEEFSHFAESKGWKNLAEQYADDNDQAFSPDEVLGDSDSRTLFSALMRKFNAK
ncbi:MAG: hypothetical protein V7642_3961 [Burkholderiales bacterium]